MLDRKDIPERFLAGTLALFPWIDVVLRLGGARLGLPALAGRGWDELLLAGLAAAALVAARTRRPPPPPVPVLAGLSLFAAFAAASVIFGAVPAAAAVDALRVTFQPVLFGVAAWVLLAHPERRDRFVDLLVASGAALAAAGIAQYAAAIESPRWAPRPWAGELRIVSIFANPNALGAYLAMLLAVVVPRAAAAPPGRRRLAYAGAGSLLAVALVLTLSRGAWLGFAAAGVLFAVRHTSPLRWLWLLPAAAVLLALAAPADGPGRLAELRDPAYYEKSAESGRLAFWSRGLESLAERPLLGSGLGRFGSVGLRHGVPGATWIDNHYLKLGAETGLAGLAAFVAFLGACLAAALRAHRRAAARRDRHLALGIAGAVVAVAVQSLTASVLEALYVGIHFYVLVALLFTVGMESAATGDRR